MLQPPSCPSGRGLCSSGFTPLLCGSRGVPAACLPQAGFTPLPAAGETRRYTSGPNMESLIRIDLNCDMGELPEAIADGTQEALMRSITSGNIAGGGHAGDEQTMKTTIEQALRWKLAIGAHPGYPDRANFGRLELKLPLKEISSFIYEQVKTLADVAARCGPRVVHVKPHGALYNQAVRNRELSEAVAQGVARWNRDVVLVGLAGSPMLDVFREAGFSVAAVAFAERRYEPDGTLRSGKFEVALFRHP